jgi:hypothetical protein
VAAKFTYNDIVCVKPTITVWFDVPGSKTPGPRVGERACIYGVQELGRAPFAEGAVYGIEFEDGDSIEVHEADLELIEPASGKS